MYKGTTPTFTLTFPEDISFDNTNVYVTAADEGKNEIWTKTETDLTVSANVIEVFLTQEETLALPGRILMQVNWTYVEGEVTKRACSDIVSITNKRNLKNEVL